MLWSGCWFSQVDANTGSFDPTKKRYRRLDDRHMGGWWSGSTLSHSFFTIPSYKLLVPKAITWTVPSTLHHWHYTLVRHWFYLSFSIHHCCLLPFQLVSCHCLTPRAQPFLVYQSLETLGKSLHILPWSRPSDHSGKLQRPSGLHHEVGSHHPPHLLWKPQCTILPFLHCSVRPAPRSLRPLSYRHPVPLRSILPPMPLHHSLVQKYHWTETPRHHHLQPWLAHPCIIGPPCQHYQFLQHGYDTKPMHALIPPPYIGAHFQKCISIPLDGYADSNLISPLLRRGIPVITTKALRLLHGRAKHISAKTSALAYGPVCSSSPHRIQQCTIVLTSSPTYSWIPLSKNNAVPSAPSSSCLPHPNPP